ncbi:MAG: zinc-ribbon domain-containing protein [Clostridia bacterium]|nr:zinc-ribbon domain-containing protein [Clostridia bacterium]
MYCKNCGLKINDDASVCPYCGVPVERANNNVSNTNNKSTRGENTIAIVGFVLSFFIAIAGLICSILGYQKAVHDGAPYKGLALAGIILSVIGIVWGSAVTIIKCAALVAAF